MLGVWRESKRVCRGCGTHPDEWEQDLFAYIAESKQCPGCELLKQEERNVPDRADGAKLYLRPRRVDEEM